MVEGNVGEERECCACCEDHVFEDNDADVPEESPRERARENKWKEVEEVCWEEEEEIGGDDDCESSECIGLYNERAPLQCWTVLLSLDRDDGIEECCADAVEDPWKDEEDAPEECEALAKKAGEKEGDDEPASLSYFPHHEDTCLAPHVESDSHQ